METPIPRFYEFGEFKIDSRRRVLTKNDAEVSISAKNFDLLFALAQNDGKILSHNELLDLVWGETFVEQSNLKKGISALRQILGETPESSIYIKTVPRKGYLFISPVRVYSDATVNESVHVTATEIIIEEEITEDDEPHISAKPVYHQLPDKNSNSLQKFRLPLLIGCGFLLISAFAFWVWNNNRKPTLFNETRLENLKPQRLTTNGDVNEATISGDGKFFVYALRENDSKQSLWLRRIGAMNALNLVPSANVDYRSIAVSADNESIFYGVTVGNSKNALYQIPILGGTPRQILEDVSSSPTFFKDGKRLGFLRDKTNVGRSLLIFNLESGKEEGEIFKVTDDNHGIISPRLSPDGKKFAFISSEKVDDGRTWTLNEISTEGGKPRQIITPRKGKIFDFRWLGDGSGIIMAAELNDSRQSQLWKINYQNGEVLRLTNDLLDYQSVNLSDDGSEILTIQEERKANLWRADSANPTETEQITQNLNLPYRFAILPNGNFIADFFENASQTLSIINANGVNSQQFLTQNNSERAPNISADGKFVYFISRQSGSDQIWRAEINGNNPQKITAEKTFVQHPKLSPDGQTLYFTRYNGTRWQLMKMPVNGGEAILVTDETTNCFDFSPDGKLLAYNFLDEMLKKWKIAVRNLSDNSIYKVFDNPAATYIGFTPNGKGLIYNVSDGFYDGGNLWFQSFEETQPKIFIELKNEKIYWAQYSKDGKNLFYTRGNTSSVAVLLNREISLSK